MASERHSQPSNPGPFSSPLCQPICSPSHSPAARITASQSHQVHHRTPAPLHTSTLLLKNALRVPASPTRQNSAMLWSPRCTVRSTMQGAMQCMQSDIIFKKKGWLSTNCSGTIVNTVLRAGELGGYGEKGEAFQRATFCSS